MKKKIIPKKIGIFVAAILALMVFAVASASALPTNGNFATGDFTGWIVYIPPDGSADVVTSYTSDQGTVYTPQEGSYFAVLKTDGPGSYTTASQSIYLDAGQTIKGCAAFDAQDYIPFNDNAYVKVKDSSNNLIDTPWYSDVNTVGSYGDGPWTYWEWTATTAGTYTLELGNANAGDSGYDSRALFSGVSVSGGSTQVPEFPTIALPVVSILGLMFIFQRRRK